MKVGRNTPCPCGSGKKHKRCCWEETQFPKRKAAEVEHAAWLARQARLSPEERQKRRVSAMLAVSSMIGIGAKYL